MSAEKLPTNISIRPKKIPLNEHMLKTARLEVFPLLAVQFIRDPKKEDYSVNVKVGTKLFDHIVESSFTDEIVLYLSPSTAQLGFWSPDMNVGFRLLSSVGIIEEVNSWIIAARNALTSVLINDKVDSVKKTPKAQQKAEELLKALEIFEKVESDTLLPMIVINMIGAKRMDPTTVIFRLGMAVYHAKTFTDQTVIDDVEDPSTLYLRLTQSKFFKDNEDKLKVLTELPPEGINQVMKFIAVMTISSYVYHKAIGDGQ